MMRLSSAALCRGKAAFVSVAIFLAGITAPAHAEDDRCTSFDWPLAIEREWFTSAEAPLYASGASLAGVPKTGFTVKLLPIHEVKFATPPQKPAQNGWGGVVHLPPPEKPGVYQITISDDAWIDVLQRGAQLASQAHTGRKDCTILRKSVRFDFGSAPTTIQLSGVMSETLKIAIRNISDE